MLSTVNNLGVVKFSLILRYLQQHKKYPRGNILNEHHSR